ncbi:hypothetical protein ACU8KH_00996 [Lachancea thermotolerans]
MIGKLVHVNFVKKSPLILNFSLIQGTDKNDSLSIQPVPVRRLSQDFQQKTRLLLANKIT